MSEAKFLKLFKSPCKNSSVFNSMTALESQCKCSWAAAATCGAERAGRAVPAVPVNSAPGTLRWVCCHLEQQA